MRKIEENMITAINNKQDWEHDNTSVHYNEEDNYSIVRLHGHKIAVINNNSITISNAGYYTNVTKSRLNVIIKEFKDGTKNGVFQKGKCPITNDKQWYIRDNNNVIPFTSGYVFS